MHGPDETNCPFGQRVEAEAEAEAKAIRYDKRIGFISDTRTIEREYDLYAGRSAQGKLNFDGAIVPGGAYPALYRIFDAKTEQLLYIGETQNFGQRMKSHAQKNWSGRAPVVSYHRMQDDVLKVHLHELENDLIGGYYEATGDSPELQFASGG